MSAHSRAHCLATRGLSRHRCNRIVLLSLVGVSFASLHCGNSPSEGLYTETQSASSEAVISSSLPTISQENSSSNTAEPNEPISGAEETFSVDEQPNLAFDPSTPSTDGTQAGSLTADAGAPATNAPDAAATEPLPPEPLPNDDPCAQPPLFDPIVGWATTAGRGLATTTGGGQQPPTIVSTLDDLALAVAGDEPRVVYIRGILEPGNIQVGSNKTIEGICGAEFHGHLEIREVQNVIVRNLTIVGFAEGDCALDPDFDDGEGCSSGADAVAVQRNAHHIWFDHCAIRDGADGNLDITNAADFITVSWTKFSYTPRTDFVGDDSTGASGHRYSNLVGGTNNPNNFDDENALNVTWHHNWWADNVVERQPRVRFGRNHLFNNLYDSLTTNYCIRAGRGAQILLEGNHFVGVDDPHEFNSNADQTTAFISAGPSNRYDNTTSDQAVGGGGTAFTDPPYAYTLDNVDDIAEQVRAEVGPR